MEARSPPSSRLQWRHHPKPTHPTQRGLTRLPTWVAIWGVQLSLSTLVKQIDDLLCERATRAFRTASGVQRDIPPIVELPEVARLDAFQVASELLNSPRVEEAKRSRLILLRRYLARAFVENQTAEASGSLQHFLQGHGFSAATRSWTPQEALYELPRLAGREAREAICAELWTVLRAHQSLPARRLEDMSEAISKLQLSPSAFVEELQGRPLPSRLRAAQLALFETQDACFDLLGYALRKLDPTLAPRTAWTHDAERASRAPWLFESFRGEDLPHALSRCLGDLGLSANADGRLTIDSEPRPGRDPRAQCFELRVPDDIRLLLTVDRGFEAYAQWLSAWGIALHRAHVGRALPVVERRLGDRALIDAVGWLFESFLLDEGWLKRYLRLTANQAKEAVRAFAFRQLLQLRQAAALALYSAEAMDQGRLGDLPSLGELYVGRLSQALGVQVSPSPALFEADPFGDQLLKLDAFALEHVMRRSLQERFNEDFWRNPAAGRWLTELASRGQRDDAMTLAQELGAPSVSLAEAAGHRVQLMGA